MEFETETNTNSFKSTAASAGKAVGQVARGAAEAVGTGLAIGLAAVVYAGTLIGAAVAIDKIRQRVAPRKGFARLRYGK